MLPATGLRPALYELMRTHALNRAQGAQLMALAGLRGEPRDAAQRVWRIVAVLAAALLGLGVILWIAANWQSLGRVGRFALLQAFVVVMLLGAVFKPVARAPLALLAFMGIGALFAYFGQTYQTGADAWQLFALWAVTTLPLAFAVRSDVVWVPWSIVAMTMVSLWMQAHTGHTWRVLPQDLTVHMMGWVAACLVAGLLSMPFRRHTGAGDWSWRMAATLLVCMVTLTGVGGLFSREVAPHYVLALVVLAAVAAAASLPRSFDIFALSASAFGLNALVLCGVTRELLDHSGFDGVGSLFLITGICAVLLSLSVHFILKLSRHYARVNGDAA